MANNDKKFDKYSKLINKVYLDDETIKNNEKLKLIQDKISTNINNLDKMFVGKDNTILGLADKLQSISKSKDKKNISNIANSKNKQVKDILDLIEKPENSTIREIFYSERYRIDKYKSYEQIYELIPELADCADTMAANIISPDDLSRDNIFIKVKSYNEDDIKAKLIKARIEDLLEAFKINETIVDKISQTLVKGDLFVAIIDINKKLEGYLKESYLHRREQDEEINTSTVYLNESSKDLIKNFDKTFASDNIKFVENVISNKFIVNLNNTNIIDEYVSLNEEYKFLNEKDTTEEKTKDDKDKKNDETKLILKELNSNRTIKVMSGTSILGYYYIEYGTDDNIYANNTPYNDVRQDGLFSSFFQKSSDEQKMDSRKKIKFVSDTIVKSLSDKLNKKFITNNPEFKELIYNLMQDKDFLEKKYIINFFTEKDVIHFKLGGGIYGKSIFEKCLFLVKLYLPTLMAAIMKKIVRGSDEKMIYVETGLDENHEGVITSFIKDYRLKNINLDSFANITTSMDIVTAFKDTVVPVVDGQKPFEIETIQGDDSPVETEFLQYLKRSMVGGTGVPEAYLNSRTDMEFAKQMSMQNANFIRKIIPWQQALGRGFTELVLNLYNRIYTEEILTFNDVELYFPRPSSLNNETTNNNISNVQAITDFIVNGMISQDDLVRQQIMKGKINRKYMPQVDWKDIDDMEEEMEIELKRKELEDKVNAPSGGVEDVAAGGEDMNY